MMLSRAHSAWECKNMKGGENVEISGGAKMTSLNKSFNWIPLVDILIYFHIILIAFSKSQCKTLNITQKEF